MKETVKSFKTYKGYEIHPLIYPRGAGNGVAVRAGGQRLRGVGTNSPRRG